MKAAKECQDRLDDIVAFVMGELDLSTARELQDHIALCNGCRAVRDALAEEEKEVRLGFEALVRSLGPAEKLLHEQEQRPSRLRVDASNIHFLERIKNMILAHKRLSAAAAAVTALAAALILAVSLFSPSTTAYALEQTVQANNHVTSYHVKISPALQGLRESWIQLDQNGRLVRAKMDFPSTEDGAKVSIVTPDRAEVWFKAKNLHVILGDKDVIDHTIRQIETMRSMFDPKFAFEQLQADRQAGKVEVATKQPAKEGEPITLTVTSKSAADHREVYEVDAKTKLVQRVTDYRRRDGQWEQTSQREYLDYNKEMDPKVLALQVPKGVLTIDRIKHKVGLDKGNLSDAEIATEVAREFFAAIIAGDYEKASPLYEGLPAEELKKAWQHFKLLRIVEIGKPKSISASDAMQVPVKVEMEVNGQKTVREFSPYIRAESGRWTISGGI